MTAHVLTNTMNKKSLMCCGTVLMFFIVYVGIEVGLRQALLSMIGAGLGVTLYHSSFGFSGAWRRLLVHRETDGIYAQLMMLLVVVVLFFPTLAVGVIFGQGVYGFVFPIGVSVGVGAFLFGIGMQLGGGCASGTLYTVGGGSFRMVITLLFFILGSVIATSHLSWWYALPSFAPYSLVYNWGWLPALVFHLVLFGGIFLFLNYKTGNRIKVPSWESWRIFGPRNSWNQGYKRLIKGPWPLIGGGIMLAVLNFATLLVSGRPWGITSGFALWGAKFLDFIQVDVTSWTWWSRATLDQPLIQDITSVMNMSLILGALIAALSAGRFVFKWRYSWRSFMTAMAGGLLLGYGARLAFGCNIGAFFSGVASGSVHAWLWLGSALLGNVIGVRLRTRLKLS